ncbi:MAG: DUF4301 family protein [Bacteroidales bacterium]|nr:DUF4301 family protein [Bacteroidales bacterium]
MITFTSQDQAFLRRRGSNETAVQQQFHYFETGFDFADLQCAATIGNGITKLTEDECKTLITNYPVLTAGKQLLKFVPASGAASRMFKEAYSYLEKDDATTRATAVKQLHQLPHLALYDDLKASMAQDGLSLDTEIQNDNYKIVFEYLLTEKGLNYGNKPKGVLKFHRYADGCRTAFEEHLVEAALYARQSDGTCRLHFTVSPQHIPLFTQLLDTIKDKYEQKFGVKYIIDFSTQEPQTDTLAATEDNQPFRDADGNLLFRPGGHGALIENLGRQRADIVFVKNIDNVFADDTVDDTVTCKKLLAAYLITLQQQLFANLDRLRKGNLSQQELTDIQKFAEEKLYIRFNHKPATAQELIDKFSRPIRVCGMVKNEGEPGGGPYLVKDSKGECSWQIVESSQINPNDAAQKAIMLNSTHFNPVDLVCAFRKSDGGYYHLPDFVDAETGFISSKSHEGRPLKAMELPGLWNGAMARWITVFVEVPLSTFHPVKTMKDL